MTLQLPSYGYTNRDAYICPTKDMHDSVYNNAIHSSQNLENNQMPICSRMDKSIAV